MPGTPISPIEAIPIADIWCSGISKFERVGDGVLRVWLYATQGRPSGAGPPEHIVTAKIVFPVAVMLPTILSAMETIGLDNGDLAALAEAAEHLTMLQ